MNWTVWDKLIVYYDEKLGEVSYAKLLYHFKGSNNIYDKTIKWYDVELIKNRLAVRKNVPVEMLERYGYLEVRNLHDEILVNKALFKEEQEDVKAKKKYIKKHAIINNVKIFPKTKNLLQNMTSLSKIIAGTFVGFKKDVIISKSTLLNYKSNDGRIDKVSRTIIRDYSKIENIIYNLVVENYEFLYGSDINYLRDYLEWISRINNSSSNEYFEFSLASLIAKGLYQKEEDVLRKVETLYNDIHVQNDFSDKYSYSNENARRYLLFVMTLISGGENIKYYPDDKKSDVASIEDAYEFNKMSDVAKLYILSQIKDVLVNNEIDFEKLEYHIYSFNTNDFYKKNYIDKLNKRIDKLILDMKIKIENERKKK